LNLTIIQQYALPEIVRALPEEADALTAIALAAKRHWGYAEDLIEQWREALTILPEFVRREPVYVADLRGQRVGFYALAGSPSQIKLDHLWVLPSHMRAGIGRHLFCHAMQQAAFLGATEIQIESDPNAEEFYARLGARKIGEIVSTANEKERRLPILLMKV
jgi:GNAT superfamily N-acetyltransferase